MTSHSPDTHDIDTPALEDTSLDIYALNIFEIRVLGVLAEKEALTPDIYPLTLNAIINGCNQLSSRQPVMQLSEETVLQTLDTLKDKKLVVVRHQAGARVAKYSHNLRGIFSLEAAQVAILTMLLLRGAQTIGELRQRCERMYRFDSLDAANSALTDLIRHQPPLALALPLAPGAKEARYIHLLSDEEPLLAQTHFNHPTNSNNTSQPQGQGRIAELEEEIKNIKRELAWLLSEFDKFKQQFE